MLRASGSNRLLRLVFNPEDCSETLVKFQHSLQSCFPPIMQPYQFKPQKARPQCNRMPKHNTNFIQIASSRTTEGSPFWISLHSPPCKVDTCTYLSLLYSIQYRPSSNTHQGNFGNIHSVVSQVKYSDEMQMCSNRVLHLCTLCKEPVINRENCVQCLVSAGQSYVNSSSQPYS